MEGGVYRTRVKKHVTDAAGIEILKNWRLWCIFRNLVHPIVTDMGADIPEVVVGEFFWGAVAPL